MGELIFMLGIVSVLVLGPVHCTMQRHERIAEAIKAGADPILAKCAIEGDMQQAPMCISRAQQVPPKPQQSQ